MYFAIFYLLWDVKSNKMELKLDKLTFFLAISTDTIGIFLWTVRTKITSIFFANSTGPLGTFTKTQNWWIG